MIRERCTSLPPVQAEPRLRRVIAGDVQMTRDALSGLHDRDRKALAATEARMVLGEMLLGRGEVREGTAMLRAVAAEKTWHSDEYVARLVKARLKMQRSDRGRGSRASPSINGSG